MSTIDPFNWQGARMALTDMVEGNTFDFVLVATIPTHHTGVLHVFSREDPHPDSYPDIYVVRRYMGEWVLVSQGPLDPEGDTNQPEPWMGYTPGEDARPERGAFPGEMFRA